MFTIKSIYRMLSVLFVLTSLLIFTFSPLGIIPAQAQTATTWYVTTTGNNSNSCSATDSPCLTINGALDKASDGDTIEVATGIYTGTGTEVVLIEKSITLSGGWDAGFTTQSGLSTIDGQTVQRGITITTTAHPIVVVEYFQIQHGYNETDGGGIENHGTLTLNNSMVSNNASSRGGGIYSGGPLTINNSTISDNSTSETYYYGASIENYSNTILNNSTISGNTGNGGIAVYSGNITINNSTITGNIGGVIGMVLLQNSIIAGNTASGGQDCLGTIVSAGYNLIGDKSGCTVTGNTGDQIGTAANPIDPVLGPLQNNGGPTFTHALSVSSPALNTGNPAAPGSGGSACLATDQRGIARPDDNICDIGAYEGYVTFVTSITRLNPSPTTASQVDFTVTFSESVTGVDTVAPFNDFALTTTGGVTGSSVTAVNGSGKTYTVTVNTGSGDGAIRLDVNDDDSIQGISGKLLGGPGIGNGNVTYGETYTIDKTPPTVSSIARVGGAVTNSNTVDFTTTFSEPVTGVDATDFTLTATGLNGAAITNISSSDDATTYTITVDTGSTDSTLRLDLNDDDSIMDAASNPLGGAGTTNGNFNTGESYTVDTITPSVLSIVRADTNPTSADNVAFTVTFSEAVTGVNAADFTRVTTGLADTSILDVSGSGAIYTVTVGTGTGSGTLHINLTDNYSIQDLASNYLYNPNTGSGDFTSGETYTVTKPLDKNGKLDVTFGNKGIATDETSIHEGANAVAIQPDGKVVMIGYVYYQYGPLFRLERYNANGSLDTTFVNGGIVDTPGDNFTTGDAITIQPDGKIIICGYTEHGVTLVRYKPNGDLDTTFGNGTGRVTIAQNSGSTCSIAIQPDGKIIVAGDSNGSTSDFVVTRHNSNGSLDTSFGHNGLVKTNFGGNDFSSAMVLQPDGKIIVAGNSNFANFAMARYNQNGSLDTTFGNQGKVLTDFGRNETADDLVLQPDGKIILAGDSYDIQTGDSVIALARYNSNGALDTTFDTDGKVTTKISDRSSASGIVLQPNGRILVSGNVYDGNTDAFALLRYQSNGALDSTFGSGGVVLTAIGNDSTSSDIALQPDGKVILAGDSTVDSTTSFTLARYDVDSRVTLTSLASHDGWILESSETSNKGGILNSGATTFKLGDDVSRRQYLGVLSFATGISLPDNADITSVTLKVKKNAIVGGGNPVATFQGFMADIKNGIFGTSALQVTDFQTLANKTLGPFKINSASGWYSLNLTAAKAYINKLSTDRGLTQIRLRFKLDDNNNSIANYLSLFSGNAPAASRPQLVITYYAP